MMKNVFNTQQQSYQIMKNMEKIHKEYQKSNLSWINIPGKEETIHQEKMKSKNLRKLI